MTQKQVKKISLEKKEKAEKSTALDTYRIVQRALEQKNAALKKAGITLMEKRFIKVEMERGKYQICEILKGDEVHLSTTEAVKAAIAIWGEQASLDTDTDTYSYTPNQTENAFKYWYERAVPVVAENIKPVLQKSKPGLTWRKLDFDIDKNMPTPMWDKWKERVVKNVDVIEPYIGAVFDTKKTIQQYLYLYGKGQDGKGTLLEFLQRILGRSYTAIQTESNAMHSTHWSSALVGKRVAVAPDNTNANLVTSSIFKAITGQNEVMINPKGKQPFSMLLPLMFIIASNVQPKISSQKSDLRRALLVHFETVPDSERDPEMLEKLWAERAGILGKCVAAWAKCSEKARIVSDQEFLEEVAFQSESELWDIFNDMLEFDAESSVSKKEVRETLKRKSFDYRVERYFMNWLEGLEEVKILPRRRIRNSRGNLMLGGIKLKQIGQHGSTNF